MDSVSCQAHEIVLAHLRGDAQPGVESSIALIAREFAEAVRRNDTRRPICRGELLGNTRFGISFNYYAFTWYESCRSQPGGTTLTLLNVRTLHRGNHHHGWSKELEPVIHVTDTELVEFRVQDASGGQLTRSSTAADVDALDHERVNPVVGPVFVDGAQPGDAIEIEFLDFELDDWGWTAIIPGFGLLADDFQESYFHVSGYQDRVVEFTPEIRVPTRPFAGTVGLSPGEPGVHDVIPPRRVGGNLDCRDLVRGSKLLLPVEVPGALLSVGDTHAAQGDGEVCGTAIETSLNVQARVKLLKGRSIRSPRAQLPGEVTPRGARFVTMGVAPDLMQATRDAVREMIDHLCREYGLSPNLAYCLCSVAVDLHISEVVDAPNWVVSAHLPHGIFR